VDDEILGCDEEDGAEVGGEGCPAEFGRWVEVGDDETEELDGELVEFGFRSWMMLRWCWCGCAVALR